MIKDPDDQMSPDASPSEQSGKSGVRRVNNLPLYIVIGGLAAFLLIMVLVAADRAATQREAPQQAAPVRAGNTRMFAREIAGSQKDGIVPAKLVIPPALKDPDSAAGSVAVARPPDLESPPVPPGMQPAAPTSQQQAQLQQARSQADQEVERLRMMKLQQFDEAVKAKTSINVTAPRSAASSVSMGMLVGQAAAPSGREEVAARLAEVRRQLEASTMDDPTAAYKARLQQLQAASSGASAGDESRSSANVAVRGDINQFAGAGQGDRWRLDSRPETPRTPYELRAGFIIPATLISGINSELPGQIVAQVSQDVYDTPLGRYKLVPQGARLVGAYASEVAYGQSRVLVAWQRIIFPDGKAMDIGAMPGADSAGYAGFKDQVNNHYFRLFSSAFLMSGITAGIAMSQPQTANSNARPTASAAVSEALGQQLGQVTAQLIAKNINIAPTLEIRPGYRFNVVVTKDMTFSKPYSAFDY